MSEKKVGASWFKAHCLGLLKEVATEGTTIVVTKRGKPVARLVPIEEPEVEDLAGTIEYHGDILEPLGEEWAAEQ